MKSSPQRYIKTIVYLLNLILFLLPFMVFQIENIYKGIKKMNQKGTWFEFI